MPLTHPAAQQQPQGKRTPASSRRARPAIRVQYTRPPLYPKQQQAIFEPLDKFGNPARISWIEASTKAGKAQPLDAIVWTARGPVQMGDIRIGDRVLIPDGGDSIVCGVYPQGERPIYRINFSDGTIVEADEEHLWEVQTYYQDPIIVTTREMLSWSSAKLRGYWVPLLQEPAAFEASPLAIDPYLLGVLIGDGSLKYETLGFSSKDKEIIEAVREALPAGHYLRKEAGDNCDWLITAGAKAASLREAGRHLRGLIAKLGLIGKGSSEKFIPAEYKINSVAVRKAIIQGILDTDGWVDRNGQPCLDQTSERLAKDVEEIIQSLGGSVLTTKKTAGYKRGRRFIPCKPVYSQRIRLADASWCFRLPRKAAKVSARKKSPARKFRKIEFVGHKLAQCIEIKHSRHLYLTNGFIPTHNTVGCIAWIYELAYTTGGPNKNYWWVAPIGAQAKIAFRRLKNWLPKSEYVENKQELTITLRNGAVIWFKGSDNPDSLYGEDVYGAVVDEGSRCKEECWPAVRSTLTATRGPCRIIGNVKGRRNWFYKNAHAAKAGKANHAYYKITAADAVAAGVLAAEEIEDARTSGIPEATFLELYYAQAADDAGNPFTLKAINACLKPLSSLPPVCWGWDLAKKNDWTVGIALDKNGNICRFERFQMDWESTTNTIIALVGHLPALIDSTGVGDPIVERVQKRCPNAEGYHFTQPSKQRLMEGLTVALQRHETSVISSGDVANPSVHQQELESFEYEYTRQGVRYTAPEGYHDDTVCSHALAVMCKSRATVDLGEWEGLIRKKAA